MKFAIWLSTLAVCLVCGLPALAQDYGKKDIVLVLDNSGSMKEHDPDFLLKEAVTRFLDQIVGDTRVSVIIFDEDARITVPFTEFSGATEQVFLDSLDDVNYDGLFTNSPMAIERAIYELKSDRREDAQRVVVFMTDGIVDTGDARKDAESSRWMREELAAAAAAQSIQIFGIAFTESADFQTIQSLALKTDADYFRAYKAEDLSRVFERLKTALFDPVPKPIPAPVTIAPAVVLPPPAVAPLAAATSVPDSLSSARPGGQPSLTVTQSTTTSLEGDKGAFEPAQGAAQDTTSSGATPTTLNKHSAEPGGAPKAEPASEAGAASAAFDPSRDIAIVAAVSGAGVAGILLMVLLIVRRRRTGGAQSPAAQARPEASLLDLEKVTGGREIRIDHDVVIVGRQSAAHPGVQSLVIPHTTIGRQHAIIEFKRYQYWIIDQNSTNGTFVNDQRITAEHAIAHGDKIRFHNCEFNFQLSEMVDTDKTAYASAEEIAELTEINLAVHGIDADEVASDYRRTGAMTPAGPPVAIADESNPLHSLTVSATGATGATGATRINTVADTAVEEPGGQDGYANANEQAEPKGQRVAQSQDAFGLDLQDSEPVVDAQSLDSWEAEVFDEEDVTLMPQSPSPDAVGKSLAAPHDAKATPWTDDIDLPDIEDAAENNEGQSRVVSPRR